MTAPILSRSDFDGVIHAHTSEWSSNAHDINDPPVNGALAFIREAIDAGFHVVIHTTRARTATTVPHIYAWLQKHGLEEEVHVAHRDHSTQAGRHDLHRRPRLALRGRVAEHRDDSGAEAVAQA